MLVTRCKGASPFAYRFGERGVTTRQQSKPDCSSVGLVSTRCSAGPKKKRFIVACTFLTGVTRRTCGHTVEIAGQLCPSARRPRKAVANLDSLHRYCVGVTLRFLSFGTMSGLDRSRNP